MVHRGRAVLVAVMVVGFTLVSMTPAMVQERADVTVQSVLAERALIPLGVDNTYTNWDVWVPPTCLADHPWTGFRFVLPASLSCFGELYNGSANPFASPNGVEDSGPKGTKTGISATQTLIDWSNTAHPVFAGGVPTPDGHFGYQFRNSVCPSSLNDPTAVWYSDSETCRLTETMMRLVAAATPPPRADGIHVQESNARVVVWNNSVESIDVSLAAIPWPDATSTPPSDGTLLARLRPDDPIFSGIDDLLVYHEEVRPGGFASFPFDLPEETIVVLAKYEVLSTRGGERVAEYDAYMAFETRERFYPLEPGPAEPTSESPTETATPSITFTPPPTPTGSPPFWNLYFPSVIFDAVAVLP